MIFRVLTALKIIGTQTTVVIAQVSSHFKNENLSILFCSGFAKGKNSQGKFLQFGSSETPYGCSPYVFCSILEKCVARTSHPHT